MIELKQEHTFAWVQGMVRMLGSQRNICTTTNPSSAAPPYWPPTEDPAELERRIRTLFAYEGSDLHGNELSHIIKLWATNHLGQDAATLNQSWKAGQAINGAWVDPRAITNK